MIRKFDSNNVEDILPLSDMQKGMLLYFLKNPDSNVYFEKVVLDIKGYIDIKSFRDTWNEVVKNHEMLRTVFAWENIDAPVQIILKEHPCNIELYGREASFTDLDLNVSMYDVPFKILLVQYEENQYTMAVCSHHILYDGWSTSIILGEFISIYKDICSNVTRRKLPKGKYRDFIKRTNEQDKKLQRLYWTNLYKGFVFGNNQYFCYKEVNPKQKEILNQSFVMEDFTKINQYINNNQITLAVFLYGAWAILISRYTKQRDISFGTTVSGRKLLVKNIENIVGLFINTVLLRVIVEENMTVKGFLSEVKNLLSERERYESTSLTDMKQYCECSDELFDSIIVIENYPLDKHRLEEESSLSSFKITVQDQVVKGEYNFIVNVSVIEGLCITISYNLNYINTEEVMKICQDFKHILEMLYQKENISDIHLLSSQNDHSINFEGFDF